MSLIYYSIYMESIFFVSYMMYLGAVFFYTSACHFVREEACKTRFI